MKKYLIVLLIGISWLSVQTVSAATLSLTKTYLGDSHVLGSGSGASVEGKSSGAPLVNMGGLPGTAAWSLSVSGGSAVVDFVFTGIQALTAVISTESSFSGYASTTFSTDVLTEGNYILFVTSPANLAYTFTASIQNALPDTVVPLPASLWLFGSAIMGMMGGTLRRKSSTTIAA